MWPGEGFPKSTAEGGLWGPVLPLSREDLRCDAEVRRQVWLSDSGYYSARRSGEPGRPPWPTRKLSGHC
jgi:hypothetical protein